MMNLRSRSFGAACAYTPIGVNLIRPKSSRRVGTGVVLVEQKLSEVNGVLEIDAPKTDAGRRSVGLPALAVDELERHLRSNVEPLATSFVFTAAEGGYLRRSNFRRRIWIPATEAVGVSGFRFHDLRHTGATLAAATGAPLRALMSRMGHSTPVAALRYQHLMAGQDANIAEAIQTRVQASSTSALHSVERRDGR